MRQKTLVATIPAGTSAAASFNGPAIDSTFFTRASGQGVVAGATTPSAALKLQASDDMPSSGTQVPNFTPTNWSDVAGATIAIAANGTFLIPPTEICFKWIRVVYAYTSGSGGTVTANAQLLGFGQG